MPVKHVKHVTVDHEKIKAWAQERQARPAASTVGHPEDALRLVFAGRRPDDEISEIGWEEFFRRFEDHNLAFIYQEEAKDGGLSRNHRFVRRKSVGHEGPAMQRGPHPAGGGPAAIGKEPATQPEDESRWEGESPAASRVPDGGEDEDQKPSIGESHHS